jgi:hypothetical protein
MPIRSSEAFHFQYRVRRLSRTASQEIPGTFRAQKKPHHPHMDNSTNNQSMTVWRGGGLFVRSILYIPYISSLQLVIENSPPPRHFMSMTLGGGVSNEWQRPRHSTSTQPGHGHGVCHAPSMRRANKYRLLYANAPRQWQQLGNHEAFTIVEHRLAKPMLLVLRACHCAGQTIWGV